MAPMAKPRRSGGKSHVMKAAKQPRSCAAAPDKVLASDTEDEDSVVDTMAQPREIETCGQLPQEDDSGKAGLGSQLPKSVVDVTAAEWHELFKQILGGGKSDDEQCAAILRATLTAGENGHEKLINQLEKQALAGELSKPNHDKDIEGIKKAMDKGVFSMRGTIGNKFYDVHKPGTAERASYHKLVGRRQRQEYRAEWALAQYKSVRVSKTHAKSCSFVNRNYGCYRPFGGIVQKEGGWNDKAAVRGTAIMALKCIKMGGEWRSRNSMTERLEFWHIQRERIEDFTEAWSMRRNEEESARRCGAMASAAKARSRGEGPVAESRGAEEPTAAARTAATPQAAVKVPGKHEIFAEAKALKAQWLRAVGDASALVERISDASVADWRWASNEFKGRVESALVAVNAAQTTFINAFLVTDLATMTKAYTQERLTSELKGFLGTEKLVNTLRHETWRLRSMHKLSK